MKKLLTAGALALALASLSTAADAAISVLTKEANNLNNPTQFLGHPSALLVDFDGYVAPNVSYVGHIQTTIETPISTSAPPPYSGPGSTTACCQNGASYAADATDYASVQGGQTGTLFITGGRHLTNFNFYMGSPDTYNHVRFYFLGGGFQDFDSDAIWGGAPPGNGDRTQGFRVYYDFHGAKVSRIDFRSDTNAFEFDNLAGQVVPEPATWALMIGGFGLSGAMMRRRRALAV